MYRINNYIMNNFEMVGTGKKLYKTEQEAIDAMIGRGYWLTPAGYYTDDLMLYRADKE